MILTEQNFIDVTSVIEEGVIAGEKNTYITGVFMAAEQRNRNNRIYDLGEVTAEVNRAMESINEGYSLLGELDHPDYGEIRLRNASHKIVELKMNGNFVIGKALVLTKHPSGAILKSLIDHDIKIGVSSRGSGKVDPRTSRVRNFRLLTVDTVATPSCQKAYPETIMEQLQRYHNGEELEYLAESIQHDIKAQKFFEAEMKKFIESIYNN